MRMKRPTVGVLPLYDFEKSSDWMLPGYMDGVLAAGGLPVMLPLTHEREVLAQLAAQCDAFLFTGGQDISPDLYREEALPCCGERCPDRDAMERVLLPMVLEQNKPLLGICRGLQMLNTALGGTLYQDLPTQHASEVRHRQKPPYDAPSHGVELVEGTPLQRLLDRLELEVNSCHHQAVRQLSPRLEAMAYAPDGLVEAAYAPEYRWVWAVQWHPEFSFHKNSDSRKIFQAFVDAACEQ